ncbi:alpha/beta fold hydrolase [Trichloromonas sp.]|uniref:alpha/beta fold hydrolase n=1 Tax=Trichloromonas sp. TaxID=3069249 RepID=UPI003D81B49C
MKANINGMSIAYDDVGTGPAVVLIHGFPFDRRMWQPQVADLVDAGYRIILPDLRGFGESQIPESAWSLATLATDVVELLNYLGIGRAAFCGASMGGSVLFHLLDRYPTRVAGACFVSSRSRGDDMIEKVKRSELIDRLSAGHREEVNDTLCAQLLSGEAISRCPDLARTLRGWVGEVDQHSLIWGLQAMRDRKDFTPRIREFFQPALAVSGGADRIVSPEHGRYLALALPLGVGYELPETGHMVNLEQTENFNHCLIEFLVGVRHRRYKKISLQKVA